jgi:hypothetical protein
MAVVLNRTTPEVIEVDPNTLALQLRRTLTVHHEFHSSHFDSRQRDIYAINATTRTGTPRDDVLIHPMPHPPPTDAQERLHPCWLYGLDAAP